MARARRALIRRLGRVWSWSSQNLNEPPFRRAPGPMWREGRAWLNRLVPTPRHGWADPDVAYTLGIEWHVGRRGPAVEFSRDNERYLFHVGVGLASLWLSYEPRRWVGSDRNIGVRIFDGGLWWSLWMPVNEWHSRDPRWRRGVFRPLDALLGRRAYRRCDLETRPVLIPLPERAYRGTATLHEDTWKRPRWPWSLTIRRVTIEMDEGEAVPIPGKGENAWDIGDDAVFGSTISARTIEAAIGELAADVLERRRRYGGADWAPVPAEEVCGA